MKFILPFNLVAAGLALGLHGAGVTLDMPVNLSLLFVAGLFAWIMELYSRPVRSLTNADIVRLPVSRQPNITAAKAVRNLAA